MTLTDWMFGAAFAITGTVGVLTAIGFAFLTWEMWRDRKWQPPREACPPGHEMMHFIRLRRRSTGSWLTVQLPYPLYFDECEVYARLFHAGWEFRAAMEREPV